MLYGCAFVHLYLCVCKCSHFVNSFDRNLFIGLSDVP